MALFWLNRILQQVAATFEVRLQDAPRRQVRQALRTTAPYNPAWQRASASCCSGDAEPRELIRCYGQPTSRIWRRFSNSGCATAGRRARPSTSSTASGRRSRRRSGGRGRAWVINLNKTTCRGAPRFVQAPRRPSRPCRAGAGRGWRRLPRRAGRLLREQRVQALRLRPRVQALRRGPRRPLSAAAARRLRAAAARPRGEVDRRRGAFQRVRVEAARSAGVAVRSPSVASASSRWSASCAVGGTVPATSASSAAAASSSAAAARRSQRRVVGLEARRVAKVVEHRGGIRARQPVRRAQLRLSRSSASARRDRAPSASSTSNKPRSRARPPSPSTRRTAPRRTAAPASWRNAVGQARLAGRVSVTAARAARPHRMAADEAAVPRARALHVTTSKIASRAAPLFFDRRTSQWARAARRAARPTARRPSLPPARPRSRERDPCHGWLGRRSLGGPSSSSPL